MTQTFRINSFLSFSFLNLSFFALSILFRFVFHFDENFLIDAILMFRFILIIIRKFPSRTLKIRKIILKRNLNLC